MAAPRRTSVISKARVEALSDLIFGLALSIGSLVLITHATPTQAYDVLDSIGEFALGFLVLISVWRPYTEIMAHVEVESTSALDLNIALMLLVALEPYLFNLLWSYPDGSALANLSSQLYSLDLAGLMFILSSLLELVILRLKASNKQASASVLLESRVRLLLVGGLFLISALRFFSVDVAGGLTLREVMWGVATVVNLGSRERTRQALHEVHKGMAPPDDSLARPPA